MIKFKKIYINLFFIIIIFFAGLLTERFQLDNKLSNSFKNTYDNFFRLIYTLLPREEISIIIAPKEYKKIIEIREKSIIQTKLTKDLEKWSKGKLYSKDHEHDIQIRLKGVFPDHWIDKNQWSFKVKIKDQSKSFNGYKRFALQSPKTTSYIYEWLFMKALEKENLFSLGADFIDVNINDKNLGAYMLIGQISKEVIKKNNKKIAPIIGFDSELWIKEQMLSSELNSKGVVKKENGAEDVYYRVKINPIQFSEKESNLNDLKQAINLLESFRQGKIKTSDAFDADHLAKVMALRALLGSYQFDWLDTKFYYNPRTKLLEPISKEIHVDLNHNYKVYYPTWWIDSYINRPDYEKNKDFFVDDLYKDKKFYEKYLKQLNYYSNNNFYKKLIEENSKEFKSYLNMLKMNYPTKKVFSEEHLEITRLRIINYLNPVQGLNVYFSNYEDGKLKLNLSNLQRLPIQILGINFNDGTRIRLSNKISLSGRKPFLPIETKEIEINCEYKNLCKKSKIDNQRIVFKIMGQEIEKSADISPFYK